MIDVIPGIGLGEKTKEDFESKLQVIDGVVPWVQIDIADNTMVANESIHDAAVLSELVAEFPNLSFEAHLMVAKPETYVKPLADAGFKRLIAHVESNSPREFLEVAKYESVEVGIAIDGATELEQVEPFLDEVDFVLVMTIEAGFSGQPFLPETLEKVKAIHRNYPDLAIEVDGGMNEQTVKSASDAGATRIVATSYLFKNPKLFARAVSELQAAATSDVLSGDVVDGASAES